jgi:protein SCO1/2
VKLWLLLFFAHRYQVEGVVLETHPGERQIVVAHRPIDNYMPAMTMAFEVGREVRLEDLAPGVRIGFELEVGKHASIARKVRVIASLIDVKLPKTPPNKVLIDHKMPSFSLVDQTGKTVSLSDFSGKVVVVDFIYTRCPLPDVCPRLSANFASVSKKMRGREVEFLSITIDPQYDTPQVLAEYARRWQAGESWRFLTGTAEQIQQVAGLFGLIYWPEEGSITHTVATAVIGRDGTLVAKLDGPYRPDELRALVERYVGRTPSSAPDSLVRPQPETDAGVGSRPGGPPYCALH